MPVELAGKQMEVMVEMEASGAVEHPVLCVGLVVQEGVEVILVAVPALMLARLAVAVAVVVTTRHQQH
jgi:hypothetical protein